MKRAPYDPNSFTSQMAPREGIAVLMYLPLHLWLIPLLLYSLPETASLSTLAVNVVVYTSGTLFISSRRREAASSTRSMALSGRNRLVMYRCERFTAAIRASSSMRTR